MTDRQLEAFLQLFDDRIQDIVDEYLQKMGRHIKDIGKLIPSDINRLIELKRMNANMAVIKRKIARAAERMERDLETVYAEAAKSDYRFQAEILNAQPPKDISENINLQRMILAQAQLTGETMRNIAQTTIVSEGYQQAIDRGIETVLSGIVDYRTAVRRAVKEAAYEGLKLKYPSGYRMRLDSAVRMNVLDGVRAVSQMARDQAGRDFDADGVEISAHNLCAKDHLPYQGKQYANAEFDEIQRELPRPFGRWNCRHIWWHIRIGITHPTYTAEQLEQFEKNSNESIAIDNKAMSRYQWTQEQRRIETAIRREKDAGIAAKANGDDKAVRDSKRNVKALMEYYQKISDEAGLTPKWERIYVDKEAVLRSKASDRMNRRTGNYGLFAVLPERMSKKRVREIASEYGVSLKGITIVIDMDTEKLSEFFPYAGRADTQQIGRIDFFPNAFRSKEELTRTLFHEKMHIEQFKKHGVEYVSNNRIFFEELAEKSENEFIANLKKEGRL